MKSASLLFVLLGALACGLTARAENVFPGAQGFGIDTPAGRGGRVIRVTTLKGEGHGSLREALQAQEPRIIVFEVGGIIDLAKKPLKIANPYVTVAGQTAPEPGITLIRGGITISTHDVLIQHLRVRPGDAGMPKKSGWSPDGISTNGAECHHVIVDHCSCTWAVDENLSASGPRHEGTQGTSRNLTFSNCIIAEGLDNASHEKGKHSKGSLIHDHVTNIAIIGNLYAHNVERNPLFKGGTTGIVVNNVIYNPGSAAIRVQYVPSEYEGAPDRPTNGRLAIVGNVMRHGKDTKKGLEMVSGKGHGDLYLDDNLATDASGKPLPIAAKTYTTILKEKPLWPAGLTPRPAAETFEAVLKHAGARPARRDSIDQRIVDSVRNGTGKIIDSQEEVGGYPAYHPTERKLNVPEKDVEKWLAAMTAAVEQ